MRKPTSQKRDVGHPSFSTSFLLGGWFCGYVDLDMRGDFAVQADRHEEFSQRFERLFQMQLAAVDLEALGFQSLDDVRSGD